MKKFYAIAALFLVIACAAQHKTLDDATTSDYGKTPDEKELFRRSEEMLAELQSKGMVISNSPISDYVSKLGASLITPQAAKATNFKFFVVRDSQINAFSTANGFVFVNLGLIARMENRLELAQVLVHESGHVVKRHVFETYESNSAKMQAANFTDLALFGTHLAYIPFAASSMSHSRDKEQQADEYSAERLSATGYDLNHITDLFAVLSEAKKGDEVEGSIWSDHPADKERAEYLKEYIVKMHLPVNAGGIVGTEEYAPIRKQAVIENVELKLINKEYRLAADSVEAEIKLDGNNSTLYALLGDCYLKMNNNVQAVDAYAKAIALDKNNYAAWRGRGLAYFANGENDKALADLNYYLNNDAGATDRRYITNIIQKMQK